jgi:cell division protein FtsB
MATAAARHEATVAAVRRRRNPVAGRPISVLRSGVTWIVVLAALLAGLVALNVAVLQLNVEIDRLSRERVTLRAENASLSSRLSSNAATPRIEGLARRRLGLVDAPPEATTYIDLGGP